MSAAQTNLHLVMARRDWDHLPESSVPTDWSLRWYQPGDEAHWQRIHRAAERQITVTPELFRSQFGADERWLAGRQCFLLNPRGEAVGTATAWFDEAFLGERWGRVHWVAILPEYQGQGLGSTLMTAVCRRLQELGHPRAFLRTAATRGPAINLYLRFGFQPLPRSSEEREVWRSLAPRLKYPINVC